MDKSSPPSDFPKPNVLGEANPERVGLTSDEGMASPFQRLI